MDFKISPDGSKKRLFRKAILRFWESSGRKNLPWRSNSDLWKVIVAEVLLRKTTSKQVATVYEDITKLSPNQICETTNADLEELLRPLGIYRVRAQQLKLLAHAIAKANPAELKRPDFIKSLPGIGRYALNTTLCFAYNRPKPALDTNMIRVVCRVFGIRTKRSRAREDKELWEFAETLVPRKRCREFNWGILDFANMVCTPRNPKCSGCPMNMICNFYNVEQKEANSNVT